MSRGRKPTPTKLKKIKGTLRKDRVLNDEFNPRTIQELPAAPDWLPDLAREEWERITKELAAVDMLSGLDLSVLAIYCNEYAVYISMEMEMRRNSRVMVYRDDDGKVKHIQPVGHQVIANRAMQKMLKIATEFGFTPSSRTRIGTESTRGKEESDPFARIAKMNAG